MKMPHHTPQVVIITHAKSKVRAVKPRKRTGTASCTFSYANRTVLLHINRLSSTLSLVPHCLKHMLPSYLWSIIGHWHFIMGGQLNMLKIKSANKWRPEGPQVKISIVLMCLTNISYCHSIGIMKASFVGSCLTKFNNKAIFGHKLRHGFLTQQLKEKKKKGKLITKYFILHNY